MLAKHVLYFALAFILLNLISAMYFAAHGGQ